jgi:hypothetical protein
VKLETIATGLTAPNWGTFAHGLHERLFVVDQDGILWAIDLKSGEKRVYLDLSERLVPLGIFGAGSFDERGFLGVAFHPWFLFNGLLYTYTSQPAEAPADFSTMPAGTAPNHQTVITEWRVQRPFDSDSVVNPESARVLLRIDQPQFNHNAGALNFGPDGKLYISLGDGGGGDDQDGQGFIGGPIIGHGPEGNGIDPSNPLGAVLRIDSSGGNSANGQYGIPRSNPFVGRSGFVEEIFAFGFRNPFRFSFDRKTGLLLLGDVGQNDIEEVTSRHRRHGTAAATADGTQAAPRPGAKGLPGGMPTPTVPRPRLAGEKDAPAASDFSRRQKGASGRRKIRPTASSRTPGHLSNEGDLRRSVPCHLSRREVPPDARYGSPPRHPRPCRLSPPQSPTMPGPRGKVTTPYALLFAHGSSPPTSP